MQIKQFEISVGPFSRGVHLITAEISKLIEGLSIHTGVCKIFCKHTSASLCITENTDTDVTLDLKTALDQLAPEGPHWRHSDEGSDDMPAHVKAVLTGNSVEVPVSGGALNLGVWQGIFLCEHRNSSGRRSLVVTVLGES